MSHFIKIHQGSNFSVLFKVLFIILLLGITIASTQALKFDAISKVDSSDARGVISVAVIPVDFKDRQNTTSLSQIEEKITELSSYFEEASYGKLTVTGVVQPKWYRLPRSEAWYGRDYEQWEMLILDALNLASRNVNFLEYDHVLIVHAGDDESRSLNTSDITSFGTTGKVLVNIGRRRLGLGISCLAELDPVGPYAHFLALNIGLPNLDKCWMQVGEWDLLAHGFWAQEGTQPVHPTSWIKLKAGWITEEDIVIIDTAETEETNLTPVGVRGGVKAVKIPLTEKTYYMIEARQKIGLDLHLPSEGVLILYIDETKLKSKESLQVIDVNPQTAELDDAALTVGEIYSNSTLGFGVQVLSAANSTYHVRIYRSDEMIAAQIAIQTLPNGTVSINDHSYTASPQGTLQKTVLFGPTILEVQEETPVSNGTRDVFTGWSDGVEEPQRAFNITSDTAVKAQYLRQHQLEVSSPYGSPDGAGWYEEGSIASLSVEETVEYSNGTRRVFDSWLIDNVYTSPSISLVMDQPQTAVCRWRTEYRLDFTATGLPEGTPVSFTLNGEEHQLITPFTFSSWSPVGEQLSFQIEPKLADENVDVEFDGYIDQKQAPITSPLIVEEPKIIAASFASKHSQTPSQYAQSQKTLTIQSLLERSFTKAISLSTRHPLLLQSYIILGSPAYWSYLVATAVTDNFTHPFYTMAAFALTFGSLIGIIYLFPLCLLTLALIYRRLHRKPRFKILLIPTAITVAGIILAISSLFLVTGYMLTLIIAGLIIASIGLGLFVGLLLSTTIIKLTTLYISRFRWR